MNLRELDLFYIYIFDSIHFFLSGTCPNFHIYVFGRILLLFACERHKQTRFPVSCMCGSLSYLIHSSRSCGMRCWTLFKYLLLVLALYALIIIAVNRISCFYFKWNCWKLVWFTICGHTRGRYWPVFSNLEYFPSHIPET